MKNAVMAMLEENAQRFPDKIALADEFRQMSYREYLTAAVLVARAITPQLCAQAALRAAVPADGVDPQAVRCNPVGVLIDRNVLSVASFMGIAYTGNFYVPLDPELPAVRMTTILQELSPLLLIDARETPGPLPVPVDVPVLDVRTMFPVPGEISEENSGKAEESSAEDLEAFLQEARELRGMIVDTDPLYAVFTSGSTGVPKGVLVSHRSLFDLTDAFEEVFGFEEDTVFGNQAPFDYDGSSKDLYNALHCGGRVEIIPHRMFMLPAVLLEYLAVRSVNTIIWAVSAVRIVADFRALDAVKTSVPLCLRKVMFSGEVMPVKTINYWMQFFPDALYVNLYGPTEITCNCTYYTITRRFEPDEKFPIGRAFPNAGYGASFFRWLLLNDNKPYGSWGNGSAMRVSFAGWAAKSLEEAELLAEISAAVTHNHPEGIKGAKAVAGCIYTLRAGGRKEDVKAYAEKYYDLSFTLDEIRADYAFDVSCQGSVPHAIVAFLTGNDFAEELLTRELHRLFPAIPDFDDNGRLLNAGSYRGK